MQNPNCQGSGPCTPGQVRLLPVGSIPDHGNSILCHHCFNHEIAYRRSRNLELAADCAFKLPTWESLKVYGEEEEAPTNLYDAIRAAGIEHDNHESDLWLPDLPEVWAILERFPVQKQIARRFFEITRRENWIDVPFAYMPWWQARQEAKR